LTTGDRNQAWIFLGGPNFGAGSPFLLKNDHFFVLGLTPRHHARTGFFIPNSSFKVKLGCLSDQTPGQDIKIPISKLDFCPKLLFAVSKYDNGRPESGSDFFSKPQFRSWKAFFAQK
jgi:hypothetical protein